jgi:hypothetical protein
MVSLYFEGEVTKFADLPATITCPMAAADASAERRTRHPTIDLAAIAANYCMLAAKAAPAESAGVVKADAHGPGVAKVAPALWRADAARYLSPRLMRGGARSLLPDAIIYIGRLHGADPADFVLPPRPLLVSRGEATAGWRPPVTGPTPAPACISIPAWRASACPWMNSTPSSPKAAS